MFAGSQYVDSTVWIGAICDEQSDVDRQRRGGA